MRTLGASIDQTGSAVTALCLGIGVTGAVLSVWQRMRDAAIVTFLATGSGVALLGLGSAFWGLVAGFVALGVRALLRE
jgi:benzoate membrane transport protein